MSKTILITGATDGIGLETAKVLVKEGHKVIVHGRNPEKVERVKALLLDLNSEVVVDGIIADFSKMDDVKKMGQSIVANYKHIDILINNAGIFVSRDAVTEDGIELRFVVNTIAPYILMQSLLPLMDGHGRVVNLSSAAQAPVDLRAIASGKAMSDGDAYAQSKLALTMWSFELGKNFMAEGDKPAVIAVNPKSFLGSKMVKQAYGSNGYDLGIGADILVRAALSSEFEDASGKYYDNDIAQFSDPHPDALNGQKCRALIAEMDQILA